MQWVRSEEHTSELQSPDHLVCRLLLEKKKRTCPGAFLSPLLCLSPPRSWLSTVLLLDFTPFLFHMFIIFPQLFMFIFFFFNDTATTEIYTLSLHDALPIYGDQKQTAVFEFDGIKDSEKDGRSEEHTSELQSPDHLVCRLLLEKKKEPDMKGHPILWPYPKWQPRHDPQE